MGAQDLGEGGAGGGGSRKVLRIESSRTSTPRVFGRCKKIELAKSLHSSRNMDVFKGGPASMFQSFWRAMKAGMHEIHILNEFARWTKRLKHPKKNNPLN